MGGAGAALGGERSQFSISPGGRLAFSDGVLSPTSSYSHLPIMLFIKGELASRSQEDGKKGNYYPEFYCQLLFQETNPGAE